MRATLPKIGFVLALALVAGLFAPQLASAGGKAKIQIVPYQAVEGQDDVPRLRRTMSFQEVKNVTSKNQLKGVNEWVESKDGDNLEARCWKGDLVLELAEAPNDLELHVLFYDIHDGARRFVEDLTMYLSDKNEKKFTQHLKLCRPQFKPLRKMELVVVVKKVEKGSMKFYLYGEKKQNSGVVNF